MGVKLIKNKRCNKCKSLKHISEFYKNKISPDKHQYLCKDCSKKDVRKFEKSKEGIIKKIYSDQNYRSKKRGCNPPKYSLKELKDWIFSQPNWEKLYQNWVESGYKTEIKPSIDRLDDKKGYSFDNIQLVTWSMNNKKARIAQRIGKLNAGQKSILQYDIDGNYINEFISLSEATRQTGINTANISLVCNGKRKSAGKFKWKYNEKPTDTRLKI